MINVEKFMKALFLWAVLSIFATGIIYFCQQEVTPFWTVLAWLCSGLVCMTIFASKTNDKDSNNDNKLPPRYNPQHRFHQDIQSTIFNNYMPNQQKPYSFNKEINESIIVKEEKRVTNHIAYEGRISNSDKNRLKALLGYKCSACGKDMAEIYGNIGQHFIELHHKIPYSDIKENEERILTDKEFCVLCPDCHRMIHKLPDASDIDLLIKIINSNKNA